MTYWQAVRSWRDKTLTPWQQIDRNVAIATGNIKFAIGCVTISILIKIWRAFRG